MSTKLVRFLGRLGVVWEDKWLISWWVTSTVLIVLQFALIAYFYQVLPGKVPLFYSLRWGEGQLVSPLSLFLVPSFAFLVLFLSIFLLAPVVKNKKFLVMLLGIFCFLVSFLGTIAVAKIISLVI